MNSMLRAFISWNLRVSRGFDNRLPERYRIDGNSDFEADFAYRWIKPGARVVDVGGGKGPFIDVATKQRLALHVTGVDISAEELAAAPAGAYDEVICGDIATTKGDGRADICICRAVLEHVADVGSAMDSIASFLKPGGVALTFVPSRNAVFARLNLLLPEDFKRALLFAVFPQAKHGQGFRSYYDRCTPSGFKAMAGAAGLQVAEARHYFVSAYFMFFFPLHLVWRGWILAFRALRGDEAAETFSMALRRD